MSGYGSAIVSIIVHTVFSSGHDREMLQQWEHIHSINGKAGQKLKKGQISGYQTEQITILKVSAVFGNWFLPLRQEQYCGILSCTNANTSICGDLTADVADLLVLITSPSHLWKQNSFCDNTSVQISKITKGFWISQQITVDQLKIS